MGSSNSNSTTVQETGNNKQVGSTDSGLSIGANSYSTTGASQTDGGVFGASSTNNLSMQRDAVGFGVGSVGNTAARDNAVSVGQYGSFSQITAMDANTLAFLTRQTESVENAYRQLNENQANNIDNFYAFASGVDPQPNNTGASINLKNPIVYAIAGIAVLLLLFRGKK